MEGIAEDGEKLFFGLSVEGLENLFLEVLFGYGLFE